MAFCTAAAHCDRGEVWGRTGKESGCDMTGRDETDYRYETGQIQGQDLQDRKTLFLLKLTSSAPVTLLSRMIPVIVK